MLQEIAAALAVRNGNHERKMNFHLVCEIEYEDGAKMTTIVGVFYENGDEQRLEECHFAGLDFIPSPLEPVRINVPKLTAREFKFLESQMPLDPHNELVLGAIPGAEAARFKKMYRYLPSFAVLEG
jgi:hypothetical protein